MQRHLNPVPNLVASEVRRLGTLIDLRCGILGSGVRVGFWDLVLTCAARRLLANSLTLLCFPGIVGVEVLNTV